MFWRLTKTFLFTVAAPGTVGVLLPQSMKGAGAPLPIPFHAAGLLLMLCGAAIYFWCAWDFVSKGFGTPAPIDAPRVLVVHGLYRFSRNPMYVGVSSLIFGQALFYGAAAIARYGCIVLLCFHLFVCFYEEPTLKRLFGEQYDDYRREVPRWLLRFSRT